MSGGTDLADDVPPGGAPDHGDALPAGAGAVDLRWDRRDALGLGVVLVVLALPVVGLLRYQGPPMEEGFMLAFPQQILDGRLPHRDFLHLYGPGSLYVLAAVFKLFGTDLVVERLVGLVQHAVVAVSLYSLLRPWGRRLATAAAVVAVVLLLMPMGLVAMAWNGALAFATAGLAVGVAAARRPEGDRRAGPLLAVAGVCSALALLYRPDLVLAVGLGLAALALPLTGARRRPLLLGAGGGLLLYVPHVLLSGIGDSFRGMFVEPVFTLRPGRALPVPPSWDRIDGFLQRAGALRVTGWPLPMPGLSQQIFLWFWLVPLSIALVLGAAYVLWRRERTSVRARAFVPAALFGSALVTQALQRPDTTHLAWVSCITFPLAMAAVAELVPRAWRGAPRWVPDAAAVGVVALVFVVVVPFYPLRTYVDSVGQTFGRNRFGVPITNGDRTFYFGSEQAAGDAQQVVDELARSSRPGERLVVGPTDLSRTNYSDAFFYYLFPDLVPGTRYIEMDPGIADAEDSVLADELRRNDWLILSAAATEWTEPNTSAGGRSQAANDVVRSGYCPVLDTPTFRLLRRCPGGSPAASGG